MKNPSTRDPHNSDNLTAPRDKELSIHVIQQDMKGLITAVHL